MVKFIDVDPDEIDNIRDSRRGRVSYPILKSFLETGKPLVRLDRTGIQQSMMSLTSCLNAYARNHDLPIKIFQRRGELYLARQDLDENGVPMPLGKDGMPVRKTREEAAEAADEEIIDITDEEVERRFQEEKGQVTK